MFGRASVVSTILLWSFACAPNGPPPEAEAPDAAAPTTPGEASPDEVLEEARDLYSKQGPREALPRYESALALYRDAGDRKGEAITLGYIGNCYKRFGDYPQALEYLGRALAMKRELAERLEEGKTLNHLGLVYWEMGDYPEATDHFTQSMALARDVGHQQLEAAVLNNLSLVYDEQGDYQRSLEQYQRALELHRAAGFAPGQSDALGNIGGVYLLLGQYRDAISHYQQALAISEEEGLKPSASQDLGNLAICYIMLGQVEEALETLDRALDIAREAGLEKDEAEWLRGKATAWVHVGQYDKALEAYREALAFYEQANSTRELIEALHEVGDLQVVLGDLVSGERDFRRAIDLARGIGHPRGVTFNLTALGDLEFRRRRYEESAALYREALSGATTAGERDFIATSAMQLALAYRELGRFDEAVTEAARALETAQAMEARQLEAQARFTYGEISRAQGNPREALEHYGAGQRVLEALGDPELGWRIAYGQGQALETLGRNQDAVGAYRRAARIIEEVRSQLAEERYRAGYIEDKYQVYVALVRLQLKMGRLGEAFFFAEKLRARNYLELLHRGMPPIRDAVQREAELELRQRIRHLQRALEEEHGKEASQQRRQAVETFSRELASAERAYQDLVDDLKRTDPSYASARMLAVPSTEQVQSSLAPQTALIEYVVGGESVSILVLTNERMFATSVPLSAADLWAKVELLRELIAREGSSEWQRPAESLRHFHIEPIERAGWLDGIARAYLVPHAILHYLPFSALVRPAGEDLRYLVDDYELAYLPSAAALVYGTAEGNEAEEKLLALAPKRARLKHAEEEVRIVGDLFPERSSLLLGSRATEGTFKRLANRYGIIHLATHGFFNKLNPLFSGVELEPDEREDGRLEVHEILGLNLEARLVTLSACETALGSGYFTEVPAGDDFVGLTRAFLFAGSRAVLASLWEVDDRSTLELMRGFYRNLASADNAEALARSQRAMSQEGGRYSHPYYWAPFVLVGRMN